MRITNIKNKLKDKRGFTMIELVVAIGLFGLIATIMFNIFVLVTVTERQIIALRNTTDNARFAVELMMREIRTGKNFSNGGNSLSFANAKSESIIYRLSNKTIEKSSDGGVNFSVITGPEVAVDYLNFSLLGQALNDGLQPRLTITIGITNIIGNQSANLKIQTTISGRFLQS